jgi:hypothetical protein
VVQEEEPHVLDHRVRPRDEARGAEGRHVRAAGRLPPAGDHLRSEGPERLGLHLVHRPGRPDERLAEWARSAGRREEARLRRLPVRCEDLRRAEPADLRQGAEPRTRWSSSRRSSSGHAPALGPRSA